jgi:hypothetical protein
VRLLGTGVTTAYSSTRMSPAEKALIRQGRANLLRRHGVVPRVG